MENTKSSDCIFEEIQFQILTGCNHRFKEGKWLIVNPFYMKDRNFVLQHFAFAKEVYRDIFDFSIIPSWCRMKALELSIPEIEIENAIREHRIPPFPEYQKLKELSIWRKK